MCPPHPETLSHLPAHPIHLGNPQGQKSLVGCGPWDCKRAGHNLVTKQQCPQGPSMLFQIAGFPFFPWLNNIKLYLYNHTILVYSFIHWQIDCSHILVTVNNAATNMRVQYLFNILFSFALIIYWEVKLLDLMIILFLIFPPNFKLYIFYWSITS